ncbi:ATP-dependent DNA helicase PIF1 [Paramuricea clavata]|uniref:ATP-dependent DNA helicase PIF1 n=1 Tax=Paramuricea clavata TaxID=317549 RepID=A0A6S7IT74_PARCT|nr:ATP-dependent DNA helicase PIF1 [Paramuricea clavata]
MSLLVSGGFHQADERFTDESRGKQCAFITLSALLTAQNTPVSEWNSATIDNVLLQGDEMYLNALDNCQIPREQFLLVDHLPKIVSNHFLTDKPSNIPFECETKPPYHTINSALLNTFINANYAILILEGYMTYYKTLIKHSDSLIKHSDSFYLFDSHARDTNGFPDPNGTAVVMKFNNTVHLEQHICSLSMGLNANLFEIVPVQIHMDQCNKTRLEKDREYHKQKRLEKSHSPFNQIRLEKARESKKRKRTQETDSQRQSRLQKAKIYKKQKRTEKASGNHNEQLPPQPEKNKPTGLFTKI